MIGKNRHIRNPAMTPIRGLLPVAVIALLLGGCSESPENLSLNLGVNTTEAVQTEGVSMGLPRLLSQSKAINPDSLTLSMTVNGTEVSMQRDGVSSVWTGMADVDNSVPLQVNMTWTTTGDLVLATLVKSLPAGQSGTVAFDERDYSTDHDQDSDGFSNLLEFNMSTDPFSASSTPTGIDLIVRRTDVPPVIDGMYEASVWDNASYNDVNGIPLAVDNLVVERGSVLPDGNTGFKFGALHDGRYLYIMGLGESTDTATLHGDSTEVTFDDSIGVVVDPDGGLNFNGLQDNDLEWIIPLVKRVTSEHLGYPNDSIRLATAGGDRVEGDLHIFQQTDGTREVDFEIGGRQYLLEADYISALRNNASVDLDSRIKLEHPINVALEYATCKCNTGQHAYEVKIDMEQAGIVLGKPFGLEIYMFDDVDGGVSDASYHWKLELDDFNSPTRDLGVVILQ